MVESQLSFLEVTYLTRIQGCSGIEKKDPGRFFFKAGLTNLPNQERFYI